MVVEPLQGGVAEHHIPRAVRFPRRQVAEDEGRARHLAASLGEHRFGTVDTHHARPLGQRSVRRAVLLPGPHPRSYTNSGSDWRHPIEQVDGGSGAGTAEAEIAGRVPRHRRRLFGGSRTHRTRDWSLTSAPRVCSWGRSGVRRHRLGAHAGGAAGAPLTGDRSGSDERTGMNLYVGGIPFSFNDGDLERLFSAHGDGDFGAGDPRP